MRKSPLKIDADAFRREDGKAIEEHYSWWKFYDFSTVEVYGKGKDLRLSVITKVKVNDEEFGGKSIVYDSSKSWGAPIKLITDIRRNKKGRITKYQVSEIGWVSPEEALSLTCQREIDNARPVFPSGGISFRGFLEKIFRATSFLPLLWIIGVFGFYVRARMYLGSWPVPASPDPKSLPFEFHHWILMVAVYPILGTIFLLPVSWLGKRLVLTWLAGHSLLQLWLLRQEILLPGFWIKGRKSVVSAPYSHFWPTLKSFPSLNIYSRV